jgi:L-alanine-DL-glutamate epimerase-like enolase superfamily enzyme
VRAPGLSGDAPSDVLAGPGVLADRLEALPVRVEAATVATGEAALADYPGGLRPTSTIRIGGAGEMGLGENVAFSGEAHSAFVDLARLIERQLRAAGGGLMVTDAMSLVERVTTREPAERRAPAQAAISRYARAAVEAALIDLGLRQAGLGIGALAGVAEARLRFVVSFDGGGDPVGHIDRLRAAGWCGALKLDVDPGWSGSIRRAIAAEAGLAILDFKGRGDGALVCDLSGRFPAAVFEDPPSTEGHPRCARDAPVVDVDAASAALACGEAINLKAPRMGGPLAALRALELARNTAARVGALRAYWGGMFEVGAGRRQARALAALFCPDAPNDLAPHDLGPPAAPAENVRQPGAPVLHDGTRRIRLDGIGFGSELDG